MFLWIKTVALYILIALGAFALAFALSIFSVLPLATDDSLGVVFLWAILLLFEASILVPLSLALTAELVERKAQRRSFSWVRALARFALALVIMAGPLYHFLYVQPYIENRRPQHYRAIEFALYCLSCAFAFLALRIRRSSRLKLTM